MGRPARHDADRLLDAAVALVTASGPRAVTMAAVARTAGAPSGSVYHRFPDQPALLAALWLRTVQRFQAGFLAAVAEEPPHRAAADAARHVVDWSRQNPAEARVLLVGAHEFAESEWAEQARERTQAANAEVERAMRSLARRLGRSRKSEVARVVLAVVDLPYAVVRRYLSQGAAIPEREGDVVAEAVRDLLELDPAVIKSGQRS